MDKRRKREGKRLEKFENKEKRKQRKRTGKKIAENRENTRDFYKICAIYIDILAKKFSAINLKKFY